MHKVYVHNEWHRDQVKRSFDRLIGISQLKKPLDRLNSLKEWAKCYSKGLGAWDSNACLQEMQVSHDKQYI